MFADPQSVTINAVANSLARTGTGQNSGSFSKDDGLVKLSFAHRYGKRVERRVKLDHAKIAADPLLAGVNVKAGLSVSLVINHPETGYTIAEVKQVVDGLTAFLTASSGANVTKILGGES